MGILKSVQKIVLHKSEPNSKPIKNAPDAAGLVAGLNETSQKLAESYQTITGHTDAILALVISPDGKLLASCSARDDKTIKLWSQTDETQQTAAQIQYLARHPDLDSESIRA